MPVVFDSSSGGVALSTGEANRLRGQIDAYIQGLGMRAGTYEFPDFKDDQGTKRRVGFTVTRIDGQTIHVNLNSMK